MLDLARVSTIPMRGRIRGLTAETKLSRTGRLGKTSIGVSSREEKVVLPTTHLDQPRASSRINDNYCVTKLQTRLLAGSPLPSQTIDNLNVKFHVVSSVHSTPGHSQKKELSPGSAGCYCKSYKLKSVKSVSCVTRLYMPTGMDCLSYGHEYVLIAA